MASPAPPLEFTTFADAYERYLVDPLFLPFARELIQRLAPRSGECVLDVGCGTGVVARLLGDAVGAAGHVVGVDQSAPMLAVARERAQAIEWREGSALALPVAEEEQFDLLTCHQCLQFVPDRETALREFRRVLRAGGRAGIGTWRGLPEVPLLLELHHVAESHLGLIADARHALGDDRELVGLMERAGFVGVSASTDALPVRFEHWETFVRLNAMALVGMSASGRMMAEKARAEMVTTLVRESEELVRRHREGDALVFELRSNVVVGTAGR